MKPKIFWVIQSNQITPIISEFLGILQKRIQNILDLVFLVPETSSDVFEKIRHLNPVPFKTRTRAASSSQSIYLSRREALADRRFTQGLSFADTLILDDLGGGNARETFMEMDPPPGSGGLVVQIPTPLGSSEMEETIFHAAVLWAGHHRIPTIGYELLPLDTRWTLAPSLTDGIVTRRPESRTHLQEQLGHRNIWTLPACEAAVFSSLSTSFTLQGVRAAYHYRNHHSLPAERTILYLPHNVAMIHEYHELLRILAPLGDRIHLMFAVGKDQSRGACSHPEMIALIYHHTLDAFASHSFHDADHLWEMMGADAVVACSACFSTEVAEKEIPCIIFDPRVPPMTRGLKKRVADRDELVQEVQAQILEHAYKIEWADILVRTARIGGQASGRKAGKQK